MPHWFGVQQELGQSDRFGWLRVHWSVMAVLLTEYMVAYSEDHPVGALFRGPQLCPSIAIRIDRALSSCLFQDGPRGKPGAS